MNRAAGQIIALIMAIAAAPLRAETLSNVIFTAFDVETTGFSPAKDRIVEIAMVKFKNGVVLESKSWLVNPGIPIPESVTLIHGISNSMVENCKTFSEIFPEFTGLIGNSVLLAHNSTFDTSFIRTAAQRNGLEFPGNRILDTLKLTRAWFPDADAHDLNSLKNYLKLPQEQSHRALGDSLTLMKVFMAGVNTMPQDTDLEILVEMAGIRRSRAHTKKPGK